MALQNYVVQRILESESPLAPARYADQLVSAELENHPSVSSWLVVKRIEAGPLLQRGHGYTQYLHSGFFDSHLHASWMGRKAHELDLSQCTSSDAMWRLILDASQKFNGRVMMAHGWNESKMGESAESLALKLSDKLKTFIPLVALRVCGHAAIVSPAVRTVAPAAAPGPLLRDRELWALYADLPKSSVSEAQQHFLQAQEILLREGYNAIGDMALDEVSALALQKLQEDGRLQLDVQGVIEAKACPSVETRGPSIAKGSHRGVVLGRETELQLRHWKRFLDGSLGAGTAWLSEPYKDRDSRGDNLVPMEELIEDAREAASKGFYLSFHALGDAAVDQVLDLGVRLQTVCEARRVSDFRYGPRASRHRIEHAQVLRPDQIEKVYKQGFWALCLQPGHFFGDRDFLEARLGHDRMMAASHRLKACFSRGLAVSLGSDAPIDVFKPREILSAACRMEFGEAMSPADALWCMTLGPRRDLGLPVDGLGPGSSVQVTNLANL